MGVKLLNKFLSANYKNNGVYEYHISMLSGKKICIDTSIFLYKFATTQKNLLKKMHKMCNVFKDNNITPVFVFDGKAPDIKKSIIDTRKINRNKAKKEYNELWQKYKNNLTPRIQKKLQLLSYNSIQISKDDVYKVKHLINLCGIKYMEAEGEADELCAALVKSKKVYGCMTDDMDMFVYGTKHIYRNFNLETLTVTYYNLNIILKQMYMSFDDFTIFCIISGMDYYDSPHNIFYNYKIYQKFLKSSNRNYYFWLIHNKYIMDNNLHLLDVKDMFNIKSHTIISKFNNIRIVNNKSKINEINKMLTT